MDLMEMVQEFRMLCMFVVLIRIMAHGIAGWQLWLFVIQLVEAEGFECFTVLGCCMKGRRQWQINQSSIRLHTKTNIYIWFSYALF